MISTLFILTTIGFVRVAYGMKTTSHKIARLSSVTASSLKRFNAALVKVERVAILSIICFLTYSIMQISDAVFLLRQHVCTSSSSSCHVYRGIGLDRITSLRLLNIYMSFRLPSACRRYCCCLRCTPLTSMT